MKIKFKTKPLEKTLEEYIKEEHIGFDEMGEAFYVSEDEDHYPMWVTCWSSFEYVLIYQGDDYFIWEYYGAENGFLKQNLLPPMNEVVLMECEGTYGSFEGSDCLKKYSTEKNQSLSTQKFRKIFDALENVNIIPNSWVKEKFVAQVYNAYFEENTIQHCTDSMYITSIVMLKLYQNIKEFESCSQDSIIKKTIKGDIHSSRKIEFTEFCQIVKELREEKTKDYPDVFQEIIYPEKSIRLIYNENRWAWEAFSLDTGEKIKNIPELNLSDENGIAWNRSIFTYEKMSADLKNAGYTIV